MNEDDNPHGYIECDGEIMGFWLPDSISPDDLGLDWVGS